jgi:4-amino-4-deoxy-L-arabinose transferase-like glycosyltransferase
LLVLLGWVALVLLFFSLSSGKRKLYIFPALPGLVLAIAPLLPWLLKRWFQRRPAGARCSPWSPWCGSACGSCAAWSSRSRRAATPTKP